MQVLGVVGSKRKKGNTSTLVQEALLEVEKEGIETDIIYLGDYNIQGCYGCEKCRETYRCIIKDDMEILYSKLLLADGLLVGTPTYFYNISTDMKAFIERQYCYEVFDEEDRSVWMSINEAFGGKLAATISICEQDDEKDMGVTSKVLDASLASLGYRIVESVKILKLFEADGASQSEEALKQAKKAGYKLARTLLLREKIKSRVSN